MIIIKKDYGELCLEVNSAIAQGRQVEGIFWEPDGFGAVVSDDPANRPVIERHPSPDSPYGRVAPWLHPEENVAIIGTGFPTDTIIGEW